MEPVQQRCAGGDGGDVHIEAAVGVLHSDEEQQGAQVRGNRVVGRGPILILPLVHGLQTQQPPPQEQRIRRPYKVQEYLSRGGAK
jgi:hypothetical protein